MLYALARAGAAPQAALAPLMAATKAQLPAFSGQQVANSLWALASLGNRDDELLALVARLMSTPHRPQTSPQVCALPGAGSVCTAWSWECVHCLELGVCALPGAGSHLCGAWCGSTPQ
jgi:hypothetical protein